MPSADPGRLGSHPTMARTLAGRVCAHCQAAPARFELRRSARASVHLCERCRERMTTRRSLVGSMRRPE